MTVNIPPMPDAIGPYRVLRPIARGGMAEVYEVEDPLGGERFALKLLMQQAGTALPRFNREYEAMTRLNHPNIVRVYQYGLHNGSPWLTMELLQGTPLQVRVKNVGKAGDKARTAEVVRIVGFVADALQYIHDRGLVHRDLKSDNVVVLPDGRVKLLDFGTAHIADALEKITADGEFVGTFAYAAPEQIQGEKVTAAADLYALGVLLYRMCTGKRPFEASDPATLAQMHAKVPPRPPTELVPNLPKELEHLILWLMAKRPEQRPPGASAVAKSLRELGFDFPAPQLALVAAPEQAVGREAELREVVSHLQAAEPGGTVLVEGGEGSGRVRFTRAVVSDAEDLGWLALSCTVARDGGVGDLLELLDKAAEPLRSGARPEGRTAAEVLRRQIAQGTFDTTKRIEALRKAGGLVIVERARIENRPLLVVVQQVHEANGLALDLLGGLRREAASTHTPVRFLLSSRDSSEEGDTPVRQRLPDLHVVALRPMSVRGVGLTVGTMLHRRPPPADLARQIHHASGGQPAYVEEVVRQLVQAHAVEVRGLDGNRLEWIGRDKGDLPLAPSARAGVDKALRRLTLVERRVLEAIALIGDDVPLGPLAESLDLVVDELRDRIGGLVAQAWLRWDDPEAPARVLWEQGLARHLLTEHLHPCRRDVLRRALIERFVDAEPSPGLVRLLLEAGRVEDAALLSVQCADRLLQRGNATTAADLLDEVVRRLNEAKPADPQRFAEVYLQHTRCLLAVRPTDPSVVRSMVRSKDLATTEEIKANVGFQKARLQSVIGHYPNFRKNLHEAWEHAMKGDNARLASTIAASLGQSYTWLGQPKTATDWFTKAREMAQMTENPVVVAYTDAAVAPFLLLRGELAECERLARDAMGRFREMRHPRGYWGVLPTWAHTLRAQGRFSEALAELYAHLPEVREAESPSHYVSMLLATARCEVDLCRLGRAQECVDELEATVRAGEHLHLRLEARLIRGHILLASGQYREAMASLYDLHQKARQAEQTTTAEIARCLLAETVWAMGDQEEAKVHFRNATLGLMGTGDVMALAEAYSVWARAVCEETEPTRLFSPVESLLDNQPVVLMKMEWLIAKARWLRAQGERIPAFHTWREAANLLNKIATNLEDTDRAALRVHPWSRQIRQGLK